jgi:hypothetical protein
MRTTRTPLSSILVASFPCAQRARACHRCYFSLARTSWPALRLLACTAATRPPAPPLPANDAPASSSGGSPISILGQLAHRLACREPGSLYLPHSLDTTRGLPLRASLARHHRGLPLGASLARHHRGLPLRASLARHHRGYLYVPHFSKPQGPLTVLPASLLAFLSNFQPAAPPARQALAEDST